MQNSVVSTQILAKICKARFKECAHHKIQQYSDQNLLRLFLYCKFMFSVQIFNTLGLTVISYRPFSISRSNIPSLPVYGVLLILYAMACYTAFNFPITNYPFLNSNIPSSPTCGFYFTAYTICHGLLLSWMSTDGQGNFYIVYTLPQLCWWGIDMKASSLFKLAQKFWSRIKLLKVGQASRPWCQHLQHQRKDLAMYENNPTLFWLICYSQT